MRSRIIRLTLQHSICRRSITLIRHNALRRQAHIIRIQKLACYNLLSLFYKTVSYFSAHIFSWIFFWAGADYGTTKQTNNYISEVIGTWIRIQDLVFPVSHHALRKCVLINFSELSTLLTKKRPKIFRGCSCFLYNFSTEIATDKGYFSTFSMLYVRV